jgi:hypothetical protein
MPLISGLNFEFLSIMAQFQFFSLRVDAKIEKIDYETIFSKQKNTLRKEHAT